MAFDFPPDETHAGIMAPSPCPTTTNTVIHEEDDNRHIIKKVICKTTQGTHQRTYESGNVFGRQLNCESINAFFAAIWRK